MTHTQPHKTIVLLSGWAGSGKDAAASLLVEEMNFQRIAFADILKEDVSASYGIPLSSFHDLHEKDRVVPGMSVTPRQLLINHARSVRSTDPDVYSRSVADIIQTSLQNRFVVSDWRFKAEYDVLRAHEDLTIVRGRIHRPEIAVSDDPTEHDLDDAPFDFTIVNDGCISDLRDWLKAVIRPYLVDA